jgi:hypothetical protein
MTEDIKTADTQPATTVNEPVKTPDQPKTFTEDQVNAIVKDRLDRDRKAHDYSNLQAAAKELAELKAAQLSEAEKKDLALKEYDTKIKALEAEKMAMSRQANQLLAASQIPGFPVKEAHRLNGETVEAMISDGQTFLSSLSKNIPTMTPGKTPPAAPSWDEAVAARLKEKDVKGSILLKITKPQD